MAVISVSDTPEGVWGVAGWAFRQILDDVIAQYSNDERMAAEFEHAKAISGLVLYLVEPSLANRIKSAIRNVVDGILAGTIRSGISEQPYGDTVTVAQYLDSLKQLSRILPPSDN